MRDEQRQVGCCQPALAPTCNKKANKTRRARERERLSLICAFELSIRVKAPQARPQSRANGSAVCEFARSSGSSGWLAIPDVSRALKWAPLAPIHLEFLGLARFEPIRETQSGRYAYGAHYEAHYAAHYEHATAAYGVYSTRYLAPDNASPPPDYVNGPTLNDGLD